MGQASDDLSELYGVSRGTFKWWQTPPGESPGHIHGKQRLQRFLNTSRHSASTEKTPVTSPRASPGFAHGHLDLSLRSPTNPISHRAVVGASVPTHFPETAVAVLPPGSPTRSFKPSLATLKAASPTLSLVHRG
ncbi:hypothetical protein CRG98_036987 [Punica granatum]|uniref:Uncharacterized protein n=1 Tax=Punica granatum TaxID=22663 RepID=A0A2I0IF44_PUNGR|nr:hypothetical protein CRG98_036987 [Punica granatum]